MVRTLDPLDRRIPSWQFENLVSRTCPLCGIAGATVVRRPDCLHVCLCDACDLSFVSPAPDQASLEEFYREYDTTHRRGRRVGARELVETYAGTDPRKDYRISVISGRMPLPGRRVLDVGFGRGGFLKLMSRQGAIVEGVELDRKAADNARRYLGLEGCRVGTLDTLPAIPSYDAILMMDLIEHVLDPLAMMRAAFARLLPGGITVLWTPNGSAIRTEAQPVHLRVDLEHMQYFTERSVREMARRLDATIEHLEQLGNPDLADLRSSTQRTQMESLRDIAVSTIKSLPGYRHVERLRRRRWVDPLANRHGTYHLFAILRKAAHSVASDK